MKTRFASHSYHTSTRLGWRAVCLATFVSLLTTLAAPADEAVDARLLGMIQANVDNPWPTTGPWHLSCYALSALYLNTEVATANDKIIEFCTNYPVPDSTSNTFNSYFMLNLIWRIYRDPVMNSRLTPTARTHIEETMWRWIRARSKVSEAQNNIWRIHDSENHNVMQKAGFLLSAEALKNVPGYGPDRLLADGNTIQQHAEAWTGYFLRYFPARAREGINVEIASPVYAKYTVGAYYNVMDFADSPELREMAEKFLHLYWADTASDWTSSGVRGGGETRSFKDNYIRLGSQYSFHELLWAYGWHENAGVGRTYALIPATSNYRVPEIITASATDPVRPNFLYTSRRFGRGGAWDSNRNYTVVFDNGNSNLRRETFVTPDYSMGTFTVDMNRSYIALIDQSRAMGVRFASGVNDRIMVFGKGNTSEPTKSFADISGVTRENCMVVQRDPNAYQAGNGTHVFLSHAVWNNRVETGGWLFTQTGNAYAAIKPADGGYTTVSASQGYEMVLGNMWAPVVIQTGQAGDYADFAAFQASVMANAFTFVSNTFNYTSEAGDTFTFYANTKTTPRVNGTTVDLNPAKTYDSPYLSMIHGENTATVSYGEHFDLVLNFGVPPVLMSLAPANGGTNAPVGAYLVATFSDTIAAGTGDITLRRGADHSVVEIFDVETSPNLSFIGSELSINPSNHLDPETAYYIEIAPTAITGGDFFAGFSGPDTWAFTTGAETITPPYTIINTGSKVVASALGNTVSTMSFTAGAWADLLVVAFSSEKNSEPYKISYNGVDLTLAIAGTAGSSADIWYLQSPYTGGAADLVVDMTGVSVVNGYGLGIMSVDAHGQEMVLHATARNAAGSPESVTLSTTADDALVVTSFNSNSTGGAASLNAPLTPLYASTNIGSARGAAGYQTDVAAGSHTYGWTVTDQPRSAVAAAFVVQSAVSNHFADWIALFPEVGEQTGIHDDPDGDGIPNGIENFFGTRPDTLSQGLVADTVDPGAGTFTFTHPQNANPADDLTAAYVWSTDLANFHADSHTDEMGSRVDFAVERDTPQAGITTVRATVIGNPVAKLFVKIQVTRN